MVFTDKMIFIHVPCTAGSWLEYALCRCGVKAERRGDQHGHEVDKRDTRLVYTHIRHPALWIVSRWKHGRFNDSLSSLWCESLRGFVDRCIERPGCIAEVFEPYTKAAHAIGCTEFCENGLVDILRRVGHQFREDLIRSCPIVNASKRSHSFHMRADQEIALGKSEAEFIAKWRVVAKRAGGDL